MNRQKILDQNCIIFTTVVFILSLILFNSDTQEFWASVGAALLSAGLAFMTYVVLKWFWLAIRQ